MHGPLSVVEVTLSFRYRAPGCGVRIGGDRAGSPGATMS